MTTLHSLIVVCVTVLAGSAGVGGHGRGGGDPVFLIDNLVRGDGLNRQQGGLTPRVTAPWALLSSPLQRQLPPLDDDYMHHPYYSSSNQYPYYSHPNRHHQPLDDDYMHQPYYSSRNHQHQPVDDDYMHHPFYSHPNRHHQPVDDDYMHHSYHRHPDRQHQPVDDDYMYSSFSSNSLDSHQHMPVDDDYAHSPYQRSANGRQQAPIDDDLLPQQPSLFNNFNNFMGTGGVQYPWQRPFTDGASPLSSLFFLRPPPSQGTPSSSGMPTFNPAFTGTTNNNNNNNNNAMMMWNLLSSLPEYHK